MPLKDIYGVEHSSDNAKAIQHYEEAVNLLGMFAKFWEPGKVKTRLARDIGGEAAADLYASKWDTLRSVLLPSVKPGIIAGCILVFVPSLGAFLAPDLLGLPQPRKHHDPQQGEHHRGVCVRKLSQLAVDGHSQKGPHDWAQCLRRL